MTRLDAGSSPRAWGKQGEGIGGQRSGRFIPTGVGKTAAPTCRAAILTVHPHGRGENSFLAEGSEESHGSSPRAWGKLPVVADAGLARRFIPTGVGKTARKRIKPVGPAVHPHGRGENNGELSARTRQDGSSPRAWGKLRRDRGRTGGRRFIPTGVGKTLSLQ